MKNKLLASSGNEKQIIELITRFYCGTIVRMVEIVPKQYAVYNSSGRIEGVEVRLVKGRYRFEMLLNEQENVA